MKEFADLGPGGPRPPACNRRDLAAVLPVWDQLQGERRDELLAHARACPACGADLQALRRAEAWLAGDLDEHAGASDGACPDPELLYALGRGPGAEPLAPQERARLELHATGCAECSAFVTTLATRPPSPLVLEPETEQPHRPSLLRPMPRRQRALIPLAAAAAVLLATFLWREPWSADAAGPRALQLPQAPLLRGDNPGPLLFPRDRVLAGDDGLLHPLRFEVVAPERAASLRVLLERHAGGALDRGERVASFEGGPDAIQLAPEQAAALEPGHYTWEAWALVDGLDVHLGRRDFEVVRDPELAARLAELERLEEPDRSEALIAFLHERGFLGDARALARDLPATPERDAYLRALPGR